MSHGAWEGWRHSRAKWGPSKVIQSRVFQHPSQYLQLELMPSLPSSPLLYPRDLQYDWVANFVWSIPIPPSRLGWILFHTWSNLKTNTGNQLLGWEAMLIWPMIKEGPLSGSLQGITSKVLSSHMYIHTPTDGHNPSGLLHYTLGHLVIEETAFTYTNARSSLWRECVLM